MASRIPTLQQQTRTNRQVRLTLAQPAVMTCRRTLPAAGTAAEIFMICIVCKEWMLSSTLLLGTLLSCADL
jgi:hypothetical protein